QCRLQVLSQRLQRPMQSARRSTMRANASEAARAKCMSMATTLQPSNAASSLTVSASRLRSPVIKKIVSGGKTGAVSGFLDYTITSEGKDGVYRSAQSCQRLQC